MIDMVCYNCMLDLFVYIFVFLKILNEMFEKNNWYCVLGMKCICKSYFKEIIFIFNVYIKILDFLIKKNVLLKNIWYDVVIFFFVMFFVVFGFILFVIVIYNKYLIGYFF